VRYLACLVSPLALLAALPTHADEAVEVESVIVTARGQVQTDVGKLDATLAETPQAISVITARDFTMRGALSLQETLRYMAGVSAEPFGNDGRNDDSLVRGVEAPIYLDGLRQTFGFYTPRTEIYGLSQVEVLKGPAGSLYGSGVIGGLIDQTSKRPLFERQGAVTVSYGTFDRAQLSADVTGPLNDSRTLAARLVVVARDSNTQVDHVPDNRFMVAPSLTWRPDDKTSVTLLGIYQKDDTGTISAFQPYVASLGASGDRRLPSDRFLSEPGWEMYRTEKTSISLLVEHQFNDVLSLSSRTRYQRSTLDYQSIYPDSYSNPTDPFIDPDHEVVNRYIWAIYPRMTALTTDNHAELKFDTAGVRHAVLAGVDYERFTQRDTAISGMTTPINIYHPVYGDFTVPASYTDPSERQTQLGFYLQDHIRIGERLALLAGVRRDKAVDTLKDKSRQSDEATTYRAAAIYDLDHNISPYVSYSESFLPTTGTTFAGATFKPTTGKQWEVGVKWKPTPDGLVTVAAYKITERNRLTSDPVNPFFSVQTGEAELRGVEVEGQFRVVGFDVSGAATFADTEITQSNTPAEVGQQLEGAPRRQASMFVSRSFPLRDKATLIFGGGVRYVGDTFSGTVRTPSYTLGDLYAAIDWRDWSLAVNANNITNKLYYASCLARGDCFLGVRRTVNVALTRQF
jgi:iron complex outermembrane receptor protein